MGIDIELGKTINLGLEIPNFPHVSVLTTGESNYCFNTRGGYKCTDVKCPPDYEPERNRRHRCRLTDEARRCAASTDLECTRRPVSLSFNFLTLGKIQKEKIISPRALWSQGV